jgi:transcriptional regulator with XRE-family HTH domain
MRNALNRTIVALRREAGLTQQEFADALGISRGAVACLEATSIAVTRATIAKISESFGPEAALRVDLAMHAVLLPSAVATKAAKAAGVDL